MVSRVRSLGRGERAGSSRKLEPPVKRHLRIYGDQQLDISLFKAKFLKHPAGKTD